VTPTHPTKNGFLTLFQPVFLVISKLLLRANLPLLIDYLETRRSEAFHCEDTIKYRGLFPGLPKGAACVPQAKLAPAV